MSDRDRFNEALLGSLPTGVPTPDDNQLARMYAWCLEVIETNQHFNLTRITEPAEAAVKHFADSLSVMAWAENRDFCPVTVLDVGTGAGFPAAPLAIMHPDWRVTAIDSTGKKVRFVAETAARLGIVNLIAVHARAEQWRPSELFALALFKAVGAIDACLADARHLIRPGGYAVHFKGPELTDAESSNAARASKRLSYEALPPFVYSLLHAGERIDRALWIYRKEVRTA